MKTRKIRVKKNQIENLLSDVIGLSVSPIGDHLTDEEFLGYVKETLPADQINNIDTHLSSCSECASKMELLFQKHPEGQEEKDDPVTLWIEKLHDFLEKTFEKISYHIALETTGTTYNPMDIESEDGKYGIFIEEKPNGDLIVTMDSSALELEGATIRLYAGKWFKEMQFTKVTDKQLGAKIRITRSEREAMSQGTVLRAMLVEKDS